MPSFKIRRLLRAMSGAEIGDGGKTNYTDFDTAGRQTMLGTAKVYRDLWLPATAFYVAAASPPLDMLATTGSMHSASMTLDVSASIFGGSTGAGQTAGSVVLPTIMPAATVNASPTFACTTFAKPLDADTSGSISCRVVWTASPMGTTGSVFAIIAGLTYLSSSAAARTAASVGACPAYNYTAGCIVHETNLGNLPSFGSGDVAAVLTLAHGMDQAEDTAGSGIAFLGAKLRYVANSLGTTT